MKKFLLGFIFSLFIFVSFSYAQEDPHLAYPYSPHLLNITTDSGPGIHSSFKTKSEALARAKHFIRFSISKEFKYEMDDVIHLSVQNSLEDDIDDATRSLALARIPNSVNTHETLRFLIALLYEKQIGYHKLVALAEANIYYSTINKLYYINGNNFNSNITGLEFYQWNKRADKIVEIMRTAETKIQSTYARNADNIRNAALISLGEKTGLLLTTGANAIKFSIGEVNHENNTVSYTLNANSSFFVNHIEQPKFSGRRSNQTDTLTITSKNGSTEITTTVNGVSTKTVLAKDASLKLTEDQMMSHVVTTEPILIPTISNHVPNQEDVEVNETRSVSIANVFSGIRLTKTVTSSNTRRATVAFNSDKTSIIITGIAIGDVTLTLTATNEAGSVVETIDITVIAEE